MKNRTIVMTVLVALLLASCVVKSLKPFYTKDTLAYDGSLVGMWEDEKLRVWEVVPMMKHLDSVAFGKGISLVDKVIKGDRLKKFEKKIKEEKSKVEVYGGGIEVYSQDMAVSDADSIKVNGKVTISKNKEFLNNKELQEIYKNAYLFINKTDEDEVKEEAYIVVPFKIKGQIFLDFTPFEDIKSNDFTKMQHIGIHTLAKLEKTSEDFKLSWLSEVVLQELFQQKKIRISHEKIGLEGKDVLLTASSEDLQKFIAKYMDLKLKDKWDGTDLILKRIK